MTNHFLSITSNNKTHYYYYYYKELEIKDTKELKEHLKEREIEIEKINAEKDEKLKYLADRITILESKNFVQLLERLFLLLN